MAWTAPRTWIAGEVVTAALMNLHLRDNLLAIGSGAATSWTAYTPTWTNATTNPAIGNGTLIGRWTQVGKIVHFYMSVAMGSTTTYGTGASWVFTLPIAGQDAYAGGAHTAQAFCSATRYGGATVEAASTTFRVVLNNVVVGESTPGTWISGNLLIVRGTYEAA